MGQEFPTTFFHLDGDNVYFKGYDSGRVFEGGYACPLFEVGMAKTVANYLSTTDFKIVFDKDKEFFFIVQGGKKYLMAVYELNGVKVYDFAGWTWVKEENQRTDAG